MRYLVIVTTIFLTSELYAQLGGSSTFEFLNLPNSAHVAAVGGKAISIYDDELSLAYYNPSLLNKEIANQLSLNYNNYFLDINYGYVAYAPKKNKFGRFAYGIHYINYGDFIEADYTGKVTGEFGASEYAGVITWSHELDSLFSVGINLKPIISSLEKYISIGLAADLGITYNNRNKLLTSALVIRNIGTQIKPYTHKNYEPVPFEIQLGITKKLMHAPFRITFLAHHLETFDLTYEIPENENTSIYFFTENTQKDYEIIADKVLRHINASIEFLPSKNFYACMGYNFQRAKELSIESTSSSVGISWGFGLKISKFHIGFARAKYHIAGSTNTFSINTNFSEF